MAEHEAETVDRLEMGLVGLEEMLRYHDTHLNPQPRTCSRTVLLQYACSILGSSQSLGLISTLWK